MTLHRIAPFALTILVALPVASLVVGEREQDWFVKEFKQEPPEEEEEHKVSPILQDENGVIPPDGHFKAMMQRQLLLNQPPQVAADAGVTRSSWTSLGPRYAGRIQTIVIHPTRTNHMLVGGATGGVFKSTDAGVTWRAVDDFLPGMAIRTLAINPTNPEQVYAGTGEVVQGVGLLRSNDFGETWQHVAGSEGKGTLYRIRFAPDGTTLYVAAATGVYRATVTSSGATFTQLHGGFADDIEVDPSNPGRVIASAWVDGKKVIMRLAESGWTIATGAPIQVGYSETIQLAYAPSNPQILYALTSEQSRGGFYRSDDGGASFRLIPNGPFAYGSWASTLWVNPFDSNSVVAGGVGMAKTTDGGNSWVSAWWPGACTPREVCVWGPVDHHEVVAHPAFDNVTNRSLYVVSDQGTFLFPDLREDRLEARIGGLVTMQFYSVAVDQSSGRVLGGTQDMGTHMLVDGEAVFGGVGPGDGGFVAIDPRNPDLYYLTIRSSTDRLQLFRMLGVDLSTRKVDALMRCSEPTYRLPDACDSLGNPESPVIMDLRAPDRLYAGGLRLWRTDNATEAVSPTSGPRWTNLTLPGERERNFISAIAVSPLDSNVVWATRNFGEIYMTTNATASSPLWVRVGQSQLPARYPSRVTISTQDPAMVYVTFGGYFNDNVWRTFDNGGNWESATGSGATALPSAPVRDLKIHPAPNGAHWIYAATEVGLFASENAGQSWSVPSPGPAAVRTDQLAWHNQDLILATHGRGLWRASVGAPTPATTPSAPTSVTGTRGNGQVAVSFTQPSYSGWPITSYTVTASPGGATASGSGSPITVSSLVNGTAYTFTVTATNRVGTGPASAPSAAVTPATVPGAPTSVSAIGGNAQATVSFMAPASNGGSAISGYTVTASPAAAFIPTGTGSPITVAGLTNGTTYTFTVQANNDVGSSAASAPSNAVTPAAAPGTPLNFAVSTSGLSIRGTWTSTGGAPTAHTLQVATSAAFSSVIFSSPLGAASSFSLDAPPGTVGTFFFRVIATNAFGSSAPTGAVAAVLPGPITPPGSPVLQNAVVTGNNVTLNWVLGSGGAPSSFLLLVGSSPGASNVGAFPIGTSTTISSSAPNGTYFARVQASNASGTATSNEISFTVGTPCIAPTPPTSPSVSRAGNIITVSWGAPATGSGPFTYSIDAGTSAGASNLGTFPAGSMTTASSAVPAGSYFLRVRAANACGVSSNSVEVSVVVP